MPSVTHVTPSVGPAAFGLGAVPLNLAKHQLELGWDAWIWSLDRSPELDGAARSTGMPRERLVGFKRVGPPFLCHSPVMNRRARDWSGPGVVHQHGIWTFVSRTTRILSARGAPTIVCPHGSLDPWAVRRSRVKKRIALLSYEDQNLKRATCLHAVGGHEVAAFRGFGLRNPIAVIPNGISAAYLDTRGDAERFRKKYAIDREVQILLFLSRITPKKGLPMLLEAFACMKSSRDGWLLVIAGADEFDHEREVRELCSRMRITNLVRFVGPLYGADKRDAYAAADLFVLPSYSEGFPLVILEALASGVPVLTTAASPWAELREWCCGWWTEISAEGIYAGLSDALSRTQEELRTMGERGRELVRHNYTWAQMATKTLRLYEWLLGNGTAPEFVVTY